MPSDPDLTLTDTLQPGLADAITAAFAASAAAAGQPAAFRPLEIAVRRNGAIVGGLIGRTGRGWLNVEWLALPPDEQRAGLGARLMQKAEAEALARGCKGVFLNTLHFQAPGFYERLGYTEFGRIADDPAALDRIWLIKRFAAPATAGAWTVALDPDPGPAAERAVGDTLHAYNHARAGSGSFRPLAVSVRDPAGTAVGGLWGYTWHGWLFVALLALGPARGWGLGTAAMRLAEDEARRRGCTGIWLDTFTFQAPGFYEKLGFTVFGRLEDYPPGEARVFYAKQIGAKQIGAKQIGAKRIG